MKFRRKLHTVGVKFVSFKQYSSLLVNITVGDDIPKLGFQLIMMNILKKRFKVRYEIVQNVALIYLKIIYFQK